MTGMKRAYEKAAIFLVALVFAATFGGCSKGCSISGSKEKAGVPKPEGYSHKGDFEIHAYDRPFSALSGPYEANKPITVEIRVLNKIYQAVSGAKVTFDLRSPTGDVRKDACKIKPENEGVYQATCTYDRTGEWEVTINAQVDQSAANISFKATIKDAAPAAASEGSSR